VVISYPWPRDVIPDPRRGAPAPGRRPRSSAKSTPRAGARGAGGSGEGARAGARRGDGAGRGRRAAPGRDHELQPGRLRSTRACGPRRRRPSSTPENGA